MTKTGFYVGFFVLIISIPVLLGFNAVQANKCGEMRSKIRKIEKTQEEYVHANKTVVAEIEGILAAERLEDEAREMGMRKMRPEDTIVIIMGEKGREL